MSLMVSHFARNLRRCTLGLFEGWPLSAGLSSKLLASTVGFTIDDVIPDACGRA